MIMLWFLPMVDQLRDPHSSNSKLKRMFIMTMKKKKNKKIMNNKLLAKGKSQVSNWLLMRPKRGWGSSWSSVAFCFSLCSSLSLASSCLAEWNLIKNRVKQMVMEWTITVLMRRRGLQLLMMKNKYKSMDSKRKD